MSMTLCLFIRCVTCMVAHLLIIPDLLLMMVTPPRLVWVNLLRSILRTLVTSGKCGAKKPWGRACSLLSAATRVLKTLCTIGVSAVSLATRAPVTRRKWWLPNGSQVLMWAVRQRRAVTFIGRLKMAQLRPSHLWQQQIKYILFLPLLVNLSILTSVVIKATTPMVILWHFIP